MATLSLKICGQQIITTGVSNQKTPLVCMFYHKTTLLCVFYLKCVDHLKSWSHFSFAAIAIGSGKTWPFIPPPPCLPMFLLSPVKINHHPPPLKWSTPLPCDSEWPVLCAQTSGCASSYIAATGGSDRMTTLPKFDEKRNCWITDTVASKMFGGFFGRTRCFCYCNCYFLHLPLWSVTNVEQRRIGWVLNLLCSLYSFCDVFVRGSSLWEISRF